MILFHTSRERDLRPCNARIGEGYEANSALGFWATSSAGTALCYVPDGILHVLHVPSPKLLVAHDREIAIWGATRRMSNREEAWVAFDRTRRHLLAAGLDGIACDMPGTDLEGAVCLFEPDRARIIGRLDLGARVWEPASEAGPAWDANFAELTARLETEGEDFLDDIVDLDPDEICLSQPVFEDLIHLHAMEPEEASEPV